MTDQKQSKKYCYTCGEFVQVTQHIYAYNEDTGEPFYREIRKCKKQRFWNYKNHPVTVAENYGFQA